MSVPARRVKPGSSRPPRYSIGARPAVTVWRSHGSRQHRNSGRAPVLARSRSSSAGEGRGFAKVVPRPRDHWIVRLALPCASSWRAAGTVEAAPVARRWRDALIRASLNRVAREALPFIGAPARVLSPATRVDVAPPLDPALRHYPRRPPDGIPPGSHSPNSGRPSPSGWQHPESPCDGEGLDRLTSRGVVG